jgi:hypothetical protein
MSEMPQDPFGPPEELVTMMKGMYNLHRAAQESGFPEHVATQFITGVFVSLMQGSQNAQAPVATEEQETE